MSQTQPFVRFRLELCDFDPILEEEEGFENTSLLELEDLLRNLDEEEEEAVDVIKTKYLQLHEIYCKYSQLKRQLSKSMLNINQEKTEEIRNKQKVCDMI